MRSVVCAKQERSGISFFSTCSDWVEILSKKKTSISFLMNGFHRFEFLQDTQMHSFSLNTVQLVQLCLTHSTPNAQAIGQIRQNQRLMKCSNGIKKWVQFDLYKSRILAVILCSFSCVSASRIETRHLKRFQKSRQLVN